MNPLLFITKWSNGPWQNLVDVERYSTLPVHRKESVAEHSYYVALYSYAIASDLREKGCLIRVGALLSRCLMHDMDEAVLGDVIRPVKYKHPKLHAELKLCAAEEVSNIGAQFEHRSMFADWIDAKEHSLEGHVLHLADGWSCVTYCLREMKLGNKFVRIVLTRDIEGFIEEFKWHASVKPYADALLTFIQQELQ